MATTNNIEAESQGQAGAGVWMGAGLTSMNDTSLFVDQIGAVFIKGGLAYQVVQVLATSTAVVAGTPVGWTDNDDFVVSAKQSEINRNLPAGVAIGTITAGKYGIIQVQGPYATIITDGSVYAAGDAMILGSSTDGQTTVTAVGTAPVVKPLAIATGTYAGSATGVAGSVAGLINCNHNGW